LHDIAIRLAARALGPGNLVLITDAMTAAGMPDGAYRLGELDVTVTDGVARLATAPSGALGAIAGSTATMDRVVRHAITAAGLPVPEVAAAASTTPARRLGLSAETGALRPGLSADLVLLDEAFRLTTVMAAGVVVAGRVDDTPGGG
jgi:N-acetylglucosamine-6-phosphate deacetylase